MIEIVTPAEFTELGVKPFLGLSSADLEVFKKHHLALSRQHHPDLVGADADDKTRLQLESKMAALNTAFLKLREPRSRLALFLKAIDDSALMPKPTFTPPPDMAMEWFELQEELADAASSPSQLASVKSKVASFVKEVQDSLSQTQIELQNVAQKYAYQGVGQQTKWSLDPADIARLATLHHLEKYLTNILVASGH